MLPVVDKWTAYYYCRKDKQLNLIPDDIFVLQSSFIVEYKMKMNGQLVMFSDKTKLY